MTLSLKQRLDSAMAAPSAGTADHPIRHFIGVEGLGADTLLAILKKADGYIKDGSVTTSDELCGRVVMNLFFENSTRTRTTFELAARRLGATVVNLDIAKSSASKGESLHDTLWNLQAMQADAFVVRHSSSGAAHFLAKEVTPNTAVINAGDGWHAHPTQAMLDMLTIYKECPHPFEALSVAIVGDIRHSRVARSDIAALQTLGVKDIRLIAPKTLLPTDVACYGVQVFHDACAGLADVDVVITLRIQNERIGSPLLPSTEAYFASFGIDDKKLAYAKPSALVIHPGPINRGVEISSSVADGERSLILKQVNNGLAIRMAVLAMTIAAQDHTKSQRGRNE